MLGRCLYFEGERRVTTFNRTIGDGVLDCEVYERWESIHTTSLSCGRKEKITITKTIGIAVEEMSRFESTVGASIGINGLANFTAELKSEKGITLTKERTHTTSFETELEADPCGRKSVTLNQLVREYHFTYYRLQRLDRPTPTPIRNIVTEYLNCFNDQSERIPVISDCACGKDPGKTFVDMEGRLGENYSINYQTAKTGSFHLWGRKIDYEAGDVHLQDRDRIFIFKKEDIPDYVFFLLDGQLETTLHINSIREYESYPRVEPIIESITIEPTSYDNQYEKRKGYNEDFLRGHRVAAPKANQTKHIYHDYFAHYEFHYHHFSLAMHQQRRMAIYTASNAVLHKEAGLHVHIDSNSFLNDPRIASMAQMSKGEIVSMLRHFDLLQMVNYNEISWQGAAEQIIADTFHTTNLILLPGPSGESSNERELRNIWPFIPIQDDQYPACVFNGPVFSDQDPIYFGTQMPQSFWRVIAALDKFGNLVAYGLQASMVYNHIEFEPSDLSGSFMNTLPVPISSISKLTGVYFDEKIYQADVLRNNPSLEIIVEPLLV